MHHVGAFEFRELLLVSQRSNKDLVRDVANRLKAAGRSVFFDEWSIDYGESIPGAISRALDDFDAMVLFWSTEAAASAWVREEFQAAVSKFIEHETRAFVVVRLDSTEIPALVGHRKWIDGRDGDGSGVAAALLGSAASLRESSSVTFERERKLAEELARAKRSLEDHMRLEEMRRKARDEDEWYHISHDE